MAVGLRPSGSARRAWVECDPEEAALLDGHRKLRDGVRDEADALDVELREYLDLGALARDHRRADEHRGDRAPWSEGRAQRRLERIHLRAARGSIYAPLSSRRQAAGGRRHWRARDLRAEEIALY